MVANKDSLRCDAERAPLPCSRILECSEIREVAFRMHVLANSA